MLLLPLTIVGHDRKYSPTCAFVTNLLIACAPNETVWSSSGGFPPTLTRQEQATLRTEKKRHCCFCCDTCCCLLSCCCCFRCIITVDRTVTQTHTESRWHPAFGPAVQPSRSQGPANTTRAHLLVHAAAHVRRRHAELLRGSPQRGNTLHEISSA